MPNYKFEARLENVELTKLQVKELNSAINQLVGKAVVSAGLNREGVFGSKLRINPEWLGIWLRKFKDLETLKNSKLYKGVKQF